MELKTLRKPAYTITIEGKPMRLRCDLNALDYLERSCGGLKAIGPSADIKTQKQLVRAFLLCNYPENAAALEAGEQTDFERELLAALPARYPRQANGQIVLPMARLFMTAQKEG